MKLNLLKKMSKHNEVLAAAAFAELGHFESARRIVREDSGHDEKTTGSWEKAQSAISFAEASDADTAREIMSERREYPVHPDDYQYGDNDLCYRQA